MQGMVRRIVRGNSVPIGALVRGRDGPLPDAEETSAGWTISPEIPIAEPLGTIKVVCCEVFSQNRRGTPHLRLEVANCLELAKGVHPGAEGFCDNHHDEDHQGGGDQHFNKSETLSPLHFAAPYFAATPKVVS